MTERRTTLGALPAVTGGLVGGPVGGPIRTRARAWAHTDAAGFGSAVVLTVTFAMAAFLALMAIVLFLRQPVAAATFHGAINQQSQNAKSLLYVAAFVAILPGAVIAVPRLADAIARGPNGAALPVVSAMLASGLALVLIAVRISHHLPWGDGLGVLLVGIAVWAIAAGAVLAWCIRGTSRALSGLASRAAVAWGITGVLVFVAVLCVTSTSSLHPVPLAIGALLGLALVTVGPRLRTAILERRHVLDIVVIVLLALAIPNVIVYKTTGGLPNIYFGAGTIQNQQDYLLGSVNQLLGGGALLVNVPVSQYGVGLIYFLAGWFHLAPIGYATLGLLDGILTALFYIVAYAVLRIAGTRPLHAAVALAVAVLALVYGLVYNIGALPETGPLRFGLPMLLVAAKVCAVRWPRRRLFEAATFAVVGIAAIWAFEAFAYTVVVLVLTSAVQAWQRPAGRRAWLVRQAASAIGACLIAHVLLASITVAATGHLPDWGQYLTYIDSFLLGGKAGAITYGFAHWSPGLAVGAAAFASAAALVLLLVRAPGVARREPIAVVALAGTTAYEIALLSYIDNRSLTYLLPYVTLPLVMAAVLWLGLILRSEECSSAVRRGAVAFAVAIATLAVSSAWPLIGGNFSQSALAHAYPGGGLRAAVSRIWHQPPVDPRAPEGVRLLDRYVPGGRALILLPVDPDLGVEILMRAHRANQLFIGDPVDDSLVPALWMQKVTAEVGRLRAGQRLLINTGTLHVIAGLRARPNVQPLDDPIDVGNPELEWLAREIDRRFAIRPIVRGRDGLMVAELARR